MKNQRLPAAEFDVMSAIWALPAPVTVPQVMETLGQQRGWKTQTLATLFARLCKRGFLKKEGEGRGREHSYYPLISHQQYLAMETDAFLSNLHQGSVPSLIASLRGTRLSQEDIKELSLFLQEQIKGGD